VTETGKPMCFFSLCADPARWWTDLWQLGQLGPLLAGIALLAVFWQLRRAQQSRKAGLLIELDRRFESAEMRAARVLLKRLYEIARNELGEKGTESDAVVRTTVRLNQLFAERPADYADLAQLAAFFETLGYLMRRRYLGLRDITGVYGDAILFVDAVYRPHLEWRRQRERPASPTLYDSTVALCRRTRQSYARLRWRRKILASLVGRDR
jgi:hypothetical protein